VLHLIFYELLGPNGSEVPIFITESANNIFKVDYTPIMAGEFRLIQAHQV